MMLIVDNHSSNLRYLVKELQSQDESVRIVDQKSVFRSFAGAKPHGIILSGGDPPLDRKNYLGMIRANSACMLNFDVPILGICEGHEIMALLAGGEVLSLKKPSVSPSTEVRIKKRSRIFEGLPAKVRVYEHHSKYVRDVPPCFLVAASSRKDRVEAMFHRNLPWFGVQFHPEQSGEIGSRILKNFVDLCYSRGS